MKNLVMTVAAAATMIFATQGVNAQTDTAMNTTATTQTMIKSEYEQVEVEALPETVTQAVATDYAGATISEAYIDEKDEKYKLVLKTEEGDEAHKVFISKEGEWLKADESEE